MRDLLVLATSGAVALETLAARSAIPVRLRSTRADGATHASPAAETIVYFGVAELITNATKHADATRVDVELVQRSEALHVTVRDDGRGGAVVVPPAAGPGWSGTGLAGLAERVRSVDGAMIIDSPHGGPTVVTVTVPVQAG